MLGARVGLADGDADEAHVAEQRRGHVGVAGGVDRGGERVGGGVAVGVAEGDERERRRRDVLERGVGVDARGELAAPARMCSPTWWRSPRAP